MFPAYLPGKFYRLHKADGGIFPSPSIIPRAEKRPCAAETRHTGRDLENGSPKSKTSPNKTASPLML